MTTPRILSIFAFCLLTSITLCAQPPGRGGDRGGRGGDQGGGFGGRGGGPPGGGFGGRGGGEEGRGGGFGGRGGDSGRGGPPGGSGGRGGDPMSFLNRFDSNGNGMLDPSEQSGPAGMIIPRLQGFDPSIKSGQSIPLKKIEAAFTKMRGGGGSNDPRQSGSSGRPADDALMPELLVPGFGVETEPTPILGFGATAEMLSVVVTDADKREANERIRRYDRNNDGSLDKEELARFSGNPMDFDRNKDGKLSPSELAVRYARRREGEEEAKRTQPRDQTSSRRKRDSKAEIPDVYNGRRSFRSDGGKSLPDGLPGFFADRDANGDGQISMAEYADEFNESIVAKFMESDLNNDGVIIPSEALRAIEQGGASSAAAGMAAMSRSLDSSSSKSSSAPSRSNSGKPDEKFVKVAERIVKRYDKNGNGELTASEWSTMLMSPAAADGNRDGKITINEYASWMQSRDKKR